MFLRLMNHKKDLVYIHKDKILKMEIVTRLTKLGVKHEDGTTTPAETAQFIEITLANGEKEYIDLTERYMLENALGVKIIIHKE